MHDTLFVTMYVFTQLQRCIRGNSNLICSIYLPRTSIKLELLLFYIQQVYYAYYNSVSMFYVCYCFVYVTYIGKVYYYRGSCYLITTDNLYGLQHTAYYYEQLREYC